MSEQKISIYGRLLDVTIIFIQSIIERMFPENTTSLIEHGTVFLSDGNVFECSIESSEDQFGKSLYLTGNYNGNIDSFKKFLFNLISELERNSTIYDIDYETKEGDEFVERNIRHPDFVRRYMPPTDIVQVLESYVNKAGGKILSVDELKAFFDDITNAIIVTHS